MIERKNRRPFYKALFYVLAVISLVVNVCLIAVIIKASSENASMRDRLLSNEAHALKLHEEYTKMHVYLDRFMRDEEFSNRVARDRQNYVKPNEFIFRFEDEEAH